ncbi:hypothetical protein NQ318_022051 [Aromia moschata]|uniref:Uncharacterized protein n=1 Tax=Aromia moschata TaxID=1265417 RepID=A0AAV8Z855_9CUCU|nr:hypothetical protein NQ318_022051 [Aromia moschata]
MCPKTNKLFCFICLVMGGNRSAWTQEGFKFCNQYFKLKLTYNDMQNTSQVLFQGSKRYQPISALHLLIVLNQGHHVLLGVLKFRLFHPFAHVVVDEGPLREHHVELSQDALPRVLDGGIVREHRHGSRNLGKIASRHRRWGLVVDAHFEGRGAPVDEVDGTLGLYVQDGVVYVDGRDVAAIQLGYLEKSQVRDLDLGFGFSASKTFGKIYSGFWVKFADAGRSKDEDHRSIVDMINNYLPKVTNMDINEFEHLSVSRKTGGVNVTTAGRLLLDGEERD